MPLPEIPQRHKVATPAPSVTLGASSSGVAKPRLTRGVALLGHPIVASAAASGAGAAVSGFAVLDHPMAASASGAGAAGSSPDVRVPNFIRNSPWDRIHVDHQAELMLASRNFEKFGNEGSAKGIRNRSVRQLVAAHVKGDPTATKVLQDHARSSRSSSLLSGVGEFNASMGHFAQRSNAPMLAFHLPHADWADNPMNSAERERLALKPINFKRHFLGTLDAGTGELTRMSHDDFAKRVEKKHRNLAKTGLYKQPRGIPGPAAESAARGSSSSNAAAAPRPKP